MKRILSILVFVVFNSLLLFCGGNNKLKSSQEYKLNIPEPSGLALSYDKNKLWTISDANSTVYLMSLQGKVEQSFSVDADDLEGITVIDENSIAVVSEQSGEVLILSNYGKLLSRHKVSLKSKKNTGLEGIAYDANAKRFFIANEKNPKLLIELNSKFEEIKKTKINFARDLSGLCYTAESDDLWIISDEDKLVAKCTVDGKIKTQRNVAITQIEGVAVDTQSKKIFLVSDKEERLYVLEMFE